MVSLWISIYIISLKIILASYPNMTCYSNAGYINDWDGYHNNIQSDYFVNGVFSVHHNHHEDRRWAWTYCKQSDTAFISQFTMPQTAYDAQWSRDCVAYHDNSAIIGAVSHHNNHKEDRVWTFYCGVLDSSKYSLTDCTDPGYLNDWDARVRYFCPNDGVIRRIYSYHHNRHEDRRWGITCCRIKDAPTANSTIDPTTLPTTQPTNEPTNEPTFEPTLEPTQEPTMNPTNIPTIYPTNEPTFDPTVVPSANPTFLTSNMFYNDTSDVAPAKLEVQNTDDTWFVTAITFICLSGVVLLGIVWLLYVLWKHTFSAKTAGYDKAPQEEVEVEESGEETTGDH